MKKENSTPIYTTIIHKVRIKLNLTCNEYCVVDLIHALASNPKSEIKGWCYASRRFIGEFLGITERGSLKIIDRLIEKGFVEKNAETKYLRATEKWYEVALERIKMKNVSTEQSSPTLNKVPNEGEQSSPRGVNKVHTINTIHNKIKKECSSNEEQAKPVAKQYGNPKINKCVSFFKAQLDGELDDSVATNRRYCKLLLDKLGKAYPDTDPVANVEALIETARKDKFYNRNATSFKYLYYNAQKITQAKKSGGGKNSISNLLPVSDPHKYDAYE